MTFRGKILNFCQNGKVAIIYVMEVNFEKFRRMKYLQRW